MVSREKADFITLHRLQAACRLVFSQQTRAPPRHDIFFFLFWVAHRSQGRGDPNAILFPTIWIRQQQDLDCYARWRVPVLQKLSQ